jgi:hypothetical protein
MASYLPPIEDVPIFDNSNFVRNNNPLTYSQATTSFLQFPLAQGNETFQDITVEGTTDLINVAQAHYTMPASNDTSLIIPSTAWVQSAITFAPSNTDIDVTTATTAGPFYMPMITGSTTGAYAGYIDAGMSYDATANNLTTTTFTGDLVGNANTATTTATSQNVALTTDNTNGSYYIPFSKTTSLTTNALYIDPTTSPLTYNPSTGRLTTFSLQCNNGGNVLFDSNTALGPLTTGLIEQQPNIMVIYPSLTGSNALFINGFQSPLVPVNTTPVGYANTNAGVAITFNTSGGNGETDFTNYSAGAAIGNGGFSFYSGGNNNSITQIGYIPKTQLGYGDSSPVYLPTYDWVNGTITADIGAITQVPITPNGNNAIHYLTFSDTNTAGNINLHTNAGIQVNPSTDTITATTFAGALSGNATSSSTSQTVSLTTDDTDANYYIPFSKTTTATSNALYIDNSLAPLLTYNPSLGRIRTFSLRCTGGGNVIFDDATTTTAGLITQLPNILKIQPSLTGSNALFLDGASAPAVITGVTSSGYGGTNAGLRIGWNSSTTNGESEFINYDGGALAGLGGFAFYSGGSVNPIELIGVIPKTQLGYGDSSAFYLPTYDWVNGTITASLSSDIVVTNTSSNIAYSLPLITSSATGTYPVYSGTGLTYNPSTQVLETPNIKIVTTGQITQTVTYYNVGVGITLTSLPRFLTFSPVVGMGFQFPIPSINNIGQLMTWRKISASGTAINFSCVGNPAVWQILNSTNLISNISVTTVMQFTWLSDGVIYTQIS